MIGYLFAGREGVKGNGTHSPGLDRRPPGDAAYLFTQEAHTVFRGKKLFKNFSCIEYAGRIHRLRLAQKGLSPLY